MSKPSLKSASKTRSAYVCTECGGEHSKWQGQCADCGQWNTLSEVGSPGTELEFAL